MFNQLKYQKLSDSLNLYEHILQTVHYFKNVSDTLKTFSFSTLKNITI